MRKMAVYAMVVLGSMLSNSTATAHHAFTLFDRDKVIQLKGTVRTFQYINPHAYIWLYVTNAGGGQDVWGIELSSGTAGLERAGWNKDTLKKGDEVTVDLHPLKDGRHGASLIKVYLPDGRTLTPASDYGPGSKNFAPTDTAKE